MSGDGPPGDTDVAALIEALRATVADARAMPMSASCIVNRAELLDRIAALAAAVPGRLADAERVLAERQAVVDAGRAEAEQILAEARAERERALAASPAGAEARAWAEATRRETDEYVESKLANFEVVLEKSLDATRLGLERLAADPADSALRSQLRTGADATLAEFADTLDKTLAHVRRGRERLAGRHHMEDLAHDEGLPPLPDLDLE